MAFLTVVFQASAYLTLALSSLILAHAEGSAFPQGVTLPLAVVAWIFTERRKALQLPPWGANVLGMVGFLTAMFELLTNSIEARLLSGAHLLVYLSWVVLFQKKEARQYLWMLALAMLQVAVGAVLTTSETYGALLAVYFCGAIWTLSLYTMWHAYTRLAPQSDPAADGSDPESGGEAPVVTNDLPGSTSEFAVLQSSSTSIPGIQHEGQARLPLGRFFLGTLLTSFACLIVAAAFFCLIPRVWIGAPAFGAESSPPVGFSMTGFSNEVNLGEIGRILESNEPVLSIKLFDHMTNRPISVEEFTHRKGQDELLFRGGVLTMYDNGSWRVSSANSNVKLARTPPPGTPRIRQEITLMPIRTNVLIALSPVKEGRVYESRMMRSVSTGAVPHPNTQGRTQLNYVAYTPLPSTGAQTGETPLSELPERPRQILLRQMTRLPDGVERLAAEARRRGGVVTDAERPPDMVLVDKFVQWLRDSGEFEYSLDASIKDSSVDPVEDFLFNRKKGHCEYYATSLALMLRAVDVPTRLISGFKGGTVNSITGAFDVEQRHAHAWVEAYVDGQWITLDATPSSPRNDGVEALEPGLPTIRDLMSVIRDVWNTQIINMNIGQQRDRIYTPVQDAASALWKSVSGDEKEQDALWKAVRRFVTSPEEWISVKGGLVSFALLTMSAGAFFGVRRFVRWSRGLSQQRREAESNELFAVEFYERFKRLCANAGLERERSQTQREFGSVVETTWRDPLRVDRSTGVPSELTELFYRVRFGHHTLTPDEAASIDARLTSLERTLIAVAPSDGQAHSVPSD